MRRYDDPVEVRRGQVPGVPGEGPEQFLWQGRLWKVRAVLAHWVESVPWWQSEAVMAVVGSDPAPSAGPSGEATGRFSAGALLAEREWWKVRAGLGGSAGEGEWPGAVFDLCCDSGDGTWQLVGCED